MGTNYERKIYQFLAFYRFLSYALAVMFTQAVPMLAAPNIPPLQINIVLSILGVYTILKIFSPLRWREGSVMTYVILIGDFVLCSALVISTGGVSSGFLLYSLAPIITASLLFEQNVALVLAAIAPLILSITHMVVSRFSNRVAWIMQGHNLTILLIYAIFCLLIASLTYRTNLNIRRRIERDAIMEERRRIGRELHDGTAQLLSSLNLKIKLTGNAVSSQDTEKALGELDGIREIVQDMYDSVRESIDQLSMEKTKLPLIPTLSAYVREFSQKNDIKVQFYPPKALPRLSPVAELQLLRIAQEALTNVRKHAQATRVELKLDRVAEAVELMVKDNGRGFDLVDQEKSSRGQHGLSVMKERAMGLGGTVAISTAPGQGTELKVSLPLQKVRL